MAGMDNNIWIIANWKSNKTIAEALDWISEVGPKIPKMDNLKVVVCPGFSSLSEIKKAITIGNFPIILGSQDLSPFGVGAYTGEEPAQLLKGLVDLAILGHSERKKNFGETDEIVAKKTQQALGNNLIPLVCIQSKEVSVPEGCRMITYEPSWAISTWLTNTPEVGKADTPENANQIAGFLKQKYGSELIVLYGGSVDLGNVKNFVTQENISGVLIGNASLNSQEFVKICQAALE